MDIHDFHVNFVMTIMHVRLKTYVNSVIYFYVIQDRVFLVSAHC